MKNVWIVKYKEINNDKIKLTYHYSDRDENYIIKFFGLDKQDIEWYELHLVDIPFIDNRIVNDKTFALRLKMFVERTQVNDLMSEEEKDYLLNVTNKLLTYQIATAADDTEIEYLKNNKIYDN